MTALGIEVLSCHVPQAWQALFRESAEREKSARQTLTCDEADQWLLLKSAMPIRMIAGVPTVPQPPHATTAFVSDTASAHAP
jgi:hypothetical protein